MNRMQSLLLSVVALGGHLTPTQATDQPNIIIILADDLGY